MAKHIQRKKGFSIIETLIVLVLAGIIITLTVTTFVNVSNYESVDKDADSALSYIQKARNQAINSNDFSEYGIRFATSSVTVFQGTTFSTASTTMVYNLSSRAQISAVSLSNGSRDMYFKKLSGKPSATGTVTFKLKTGTTTKSLIIYSTGLSELQ